MSRSLTRRQVVGGIAAGAGLAICPGESGAAAPSILFREVTLVDGTGAPPRFADVLVTGDRIARISPPGRGG